MYYAVRTGLTPGIYTTWKDCEAQVRGFPHASYKKFQSEEEAKAYLSGTPTNVKPLKADVTIYVDGSYDSNTGVYGYGMVAIHANGVIKEYLEANNEPETAKLRNVAGEILAAMHAVLYAKKQNCKSLLICYDYAGIEKWAVGEWKGKNPCTVAYADFMNLQRDQLDIHFQKIAAHTGVKYNERADQLAKSAVKDFNRKRL